MGTFACAILNCETGQESGTHIFVIVAGEHPKHDDASISIAGFDVEAKAYHCKTVYEKECNTKELLDALSKQTGKCMYLGKVYEIVHGRIYSQPKQTALPRYPSKIERLGKSPVKAAKSTGVERIVFKDSGLPVKGANARPDDTPSTLNNEPSITFSKELHSLSPVQKERFGHKKRMIAHSFSRKQKLIDEGRSYMCLRCGKRVALYNGLCYLCHLNEQGRG